jgi:hypothetical protein
MSFGNTTENDILQYVYNSVVPAWASNTDFYLALHTADPGEGGAQDTTEANYTGYARVALARDDASAFTVSGNAVTTAALTQLGLCTAGSSSCTHWSIGTASTGAGQIIHKGPLAVTLGVVPPIQPQFNAGDLDWSLD